MPPINNLMKTSLIGALVILCFHAAAQTLPFDLAIPPAAGNVTLEANHEIKVLSLTPNGGTYTLRVIPAKYAHTPDAGTTNNYNFIRVEEAFFGDMDATDMANALPNQKTNVYQYFDGLGRVIQTVDNKSSPNYKDVITPVTYDQYGRQTRQYLPYTDFNDGRYLSTAIADQAAFYSTTKVYNQKVKTDAKPWSDAKFEASPLNRIIEQGAPGAAWQPNASDLNGHTIKKQYLTNIDGTSTGQEKIQVWSITAHNADFILTQNGYYATGSLFVNVTIDEHGRQVREYTDKQGKVILKKVQYVDSADIHDDSDWTLTYYIYDDFDRLRFVLQPKFMARFSTYTAATNASKKGMLDSLSFEYRYDERGRMIYKRVPGAKHVEMVYDKWDRLVLSQDGNQRAAGKWSFTKYDVLNRPIITGELASANDRSAMVTAVANDADRFETTASGNSIGYTVNQCYPTVSLGDIYTITYYDDYDFKTRLSLGTAYDASIPSGFTGVVHNRVKGLATGSKVRVLGTSDYLLTANYYDDQYRVLQTIGDDILGNKNRVTNQYYGITLWITKTLLHHGAPTAVSILTEMDIDHRGRVQKVWQTMDGGTRVLMAANQYNESGQLVEKNIHSVDNGATFLQSVDYRYNIRGWMTHINNSALSKDVNVNDDTDDIFGMELKYETALSVNGTNTAAQYNGNISAMTWKTKNLVDAPVEKAYGFSYDPLNRLLDARYSTKSGSAFTANADMFNETLTYDKNGNIGQLTRTGSLNGAKETVDQLAYRYHGNTLMNVNDNSSHALPATKLPEHGFTETSSSHVAAVNEYFYDANGNMSVDYNKEIDTIYYNHLNLPKVVELSGNRKIEYYYDAAGAKLKQKVTENGTVKSQSVYIGGLHYESQSSAAPVLKFVSTSEGRVVKSGTTWKYEYFHKDHLGNVRSVYGYMPQVDSYTATMESTVSAKEEAMFMNVAATRKIGHNHTLATGDYTAPNYASETNGFVSGKAVGPAKVLQVSAGDTVDIEVFATYQNEVGSSNNVISSLAAALTSAFGLGSGEIAYQTIHSNIGTIAGGISRDGDAAKAYLFYVVLDNNYNYVGSGQSAGFASITTNAENAWERLHLNILVPHNGYLYTCVVNESSVSGTTSVYFDDLKIVHSRNSSALQVVQVQDYYPFGLTFNSYSRENSAPQDYKFNGKEEQNELGLGWIDYGLRMYQPDIGRWGVVDPAADKYHSYSPFVYCGNNPTNIVDPNGADWIIERTEKDGKVSYNITLNAKVYNNSGKKLDMGALTKQMKSQLESTFSTGNIDGDIEVNTTVNIEAVSSLDDVKDTDHLVMIEDDQKYEEMASEQGGVNTNGYADAGGLKVVLPHKTAAGILDGTNTRTISHEFGHTGGLYHPDAVTDTRVQGVNKYDKGDGNNLMYGNSSGGKSIKAAQIQAMYNYYQAGRINQQTQFKREGHIMYTPALYPGLMYYQTRGGVNYTGQKWVDWKDRVFGPSN